MVDIEIIVSTLQDCTKGAIKELDALDASDPACKERRAAISNRYSAYCEVFDAICDHLDVETDRWRLSDQIRAQTSLYHGELRRKEGTL